ncbi:hypothetical protein [Clostridium hydrogenum]|nr:hypothetical protein [Clostridium hydrogenum]
MIGYMIYGITNYPMKEILKRLKKDSFYWYKRVVEINGQKLELEGE